MDEPRQPAQSQPLPQELLELRNQIDEIDSDLLNALARRTELVAHVAKVKKRHAVPIRDRIREAAIGSGLPVCLSY